MIIYGILNKVSGKYYIGSAVNFSKRKSRHLKLLRENKHHSYLLQKEWDENLFDFIILEKVLGKEFLTEREQWWIDNTNSFYNICKIASSSLGVKRTEETKEKVRQANLGLKHPEWRNNIKSKAQGGENHWTKKKSFSKESKEKMSRSQKKLYEDGYISPRLGVVLSKETIDKLTSFVDVDDELDNTDTDDNPEDTNHFLNEELLTHTKIKNNFFMTDGKSFIL